MIEERARCLRVRRELSSNVRPMSPHSYGYRTGSWLQAKCLPEIQTGNQSRSIVTTSAEQNVIKFSDKDRIIAQSSISRTDLRSHPLIRQASVEGLATDSMLKSNISHGTLQFQLRIRNDHIVRPESENVLRDEADHPVDVANRHSIISGIEIGLSFVNSPALLLYEGKVIASNVAASRMLSASTILRLEDGVLRTRREKEAQALTAMIEEASKAISQEPHKRTLVLSNRQSQPVMLLSLQTLGRPALGPLCVLRIADLHSKTSIDPDMLRAQLGLTRGEARVAAALISDRSIAAIAAALNLAPETVRTHLKRLMAKLGVRSQAQMLSLLYEAVAISTTIQPAKQ